MSAEQVTQRRRWLDHHDRASCLRTIAQILKMGPHAASYTYVISVQLQAEHWDAARGIGAARRALNSMRGRRAGQARDFDNESDACVAEIVIGQICVHHEHAKLQALLWHLPLKGYDVRIGETPIDVKAVRENSNAVHVNFESHKRAGSQIYLIARVARHDVLDLFVISHRAVSDWELVDTYKGQAIEPARVYLRNALPQRMLGGPNVKTTTNTTTTQPPEQRA